jgi:hypothetical protein
VGRELRALAQPELAAPAPAQSQRGDIVVLTPRVVEIAAPSAGPPVRRVPRKPRVLPTAVYVAYRRRSASGAIRVATGVAGQPGR